MSIFQGVFALLGPRVNLQQLGAMDLPKIIFYEARNQISPGDF